MYIPKYKRRKIIQWVVAITIITLIAIFVNSIWYNHFKNYSDVKVMNAKELHYDADGPFIMINNDDHLIGFYIGSTPIIHYKYNEYVEEGIYDVEYNEYEDSLYIKRGNGDIAGYINMNHNLELTMNFADAKVLVYNK